MASTLAATSKTRSPSLVQTLLEVIKESIASATKPTNNSYSNQDIAHLKRELNLNLHHQPKAITSHISRPSEALIPPPKSMSWALPTKPMPILPQRRLPISMRATRSSFLILSWKTIWEWVSLSNRNIRLQLREILRIIPWLRRRQTLLHSQRLVERPPWGRRMSMLLWWGWLRSLIMESCLRISRMSLPLEKILTCVMLLESLIREEMDRLIWRNYRMDMQAFW